MKKVQVQAPTRKRRGSRGGRFRWWTVLLLLLLSGGVDVAIRIAAKAPAPPVLNQPAPEWSKRIER